MGSSNFFVEWPLIYLFIFGEKGVYLNSIVGIHFAMAKHLI